MPPIVIDGKTTNQKQLVQDVKTHVKGDFSIKHTNYNTILFIENKENYEKLINNIKTEKIYHTYTSNEDKSHAFVLRGLATGTKIPDIEECLDDDHEIKNKIHLPDEHQRQAPVPGSYRSCDNPRKSE